MILTETSFGVTTENAENDKKLYLKGVFVESERQNKNGRKYQRSEVVKAVDKINEAASKGQHILGELDHPPKLEVSLKNVSHRIEEMHMDGNNAIGKALILDTPTGQIAKSLIEAGVNLGVSTRGSGSVKNDGLVEDFDLVTVDLVANPSANDAYPKSIYEQLEQYYRNNEMYELAEAVKKDKKAQKYFAKELKKFIESLKS